METNTIVEAVANETATLLGMVQNFSAQYGVKIIAWLLVLLIFALLIKGIKKGIRFLINLFDMDI